MTGPRDPRGFDETVQAPSTDPALAETRQSGGQGLAEGDLQVGAHLGDRYLISGFLGRGGMGAVYLARDEALDGKLVALKMVTRQAAGTSGIDRLRNEVLLAQKVTHPGVCRTYDLEEADGRWLVKMEYVAGESLAQRLARGPLGVDEAAGIARAIAEALGAAHRQGVVHRDLKPANVMIEEGTGRVVLMDFGIARPAARTGETAEEIAGTPDYMAPEQVRAQAVDGRTDLYALGCVLYHMLAGEVVFPARTAMAVGLRHIEDEPPLVNARRPEVPAWLARAVARLLEKDPARRPADATAALTLLAEPVRRRRPWLVPTAALALAGVAGIAVALQTRGDDRREDTAAVPVPGWTPAIVEPHPSYEENAEVPAISPDGQQLAVPSDREGAGRFRVFVGPLAGGKPARPVTPPEMTVYAAFWEADGRALLVMDASGPERMVRRVPLDGGSSTEVARNALVTTCGRGMLLLELIIAGCEGCSRLVLRAPDGERREIRRFAPGQLVIRPRCDAAGRQAVYALASERSLSPPADLWLLSLDGGEPRRLTSDGAQNGYPVFHPDGRSIVYSSARGGRRNLWELPLEGGEPVQITSGDGDDVGPDIAPDGSILIFNQDVTWMPLLTRPLAGGDSRRVTPTRLRLSNLAATPDGTEVIATELAAGGARRVIAVSLADGSDRELAAGGGFATISSDGREVIYASTGAPATLYAVPLHGGRRRTVGTVDGQVTERLRTGPDGRIYTVARGRQGLTTWRIPEPGGRAEPAVAPPWCAVLPAPAGGWRVVDDCAAAARVAELVPPGKQPGDPGNRRLGAVTHLAFEPGGRWLVYGGTGGQVRRHDLASGKETVLFTAPLLAGLAVSADGASIHYSEFVARVRRQIITNFGERPRP